MMPRLFTADVKAMAVSGTSAQGAASMMPRLFTADVKAMGRTHRGIGSRFNDAAAVHRGCPPRVSRATRLLRELQ